MVKSNSFAIVCIDSYDFTATMYNDSVKLSLNEEFHTLSNKICHTLILGNSIQNVLACRKDWSGEELECIDPVCLMICIYFVRLFVCSLAGRANVEQKWEKKIESEESFDLIGRIQIIDKHVSC